MQTVHCLPAALWPLALGPVGTSLMGVFISLPATESMTWRGSAGALGQEAEVQ